MHPYTKVTAVVAGSYHCFAIAASEDGRAPDTGSDWSRHGLTTILIVYQYREYTQCHCTVPAHYTNSLIQCRPITRAGCLYGVDQSQEPVAASLGVGSASEVFGWGLNCYGQLGYYDFAKKSADQLEYFPLRVPSLSGRGIVGGDGGEHHTVMRTAGGRASQPALVIGRHCVTACV